MPTTPTTSLTTTTQDLEPMVHKVNQLLREGKFEDADKIGERLTQEGRIIATKVAQAAAAARTVGTLETTSTSEPQVETPPPHLTALPFAELAAHPTLLERGIDLQQQLDSHVQMMIAMGIIPEDKRSTYVQKFATISVNTEELTKAPKNWRPQLFLDDMTPDQALNTYIKNTQVTVFEWATISRYKKVSPKTKQRLPDDQQLPSGLARFTFTSNNTTGNTADYQLTQQVKGTKHMQPKQWFQMFMEDLNKAIKNLKLGNGKAWKDLSEEEKVAILGNHAIDQFLPDVSTVTQCPEYRNENGLVLRLYWDPDDRKVYVYRCNPGVPFDDVGVRKVLG